MSQAITISEIRNLIFHIRGKTVMMDNDLASLYQVETGRLNEAVRRNIKRFPEDFMFQLTEAEFERLRSQFAISKAGRGGRAVICPLHLQNKVSQCSHVSSTVILQ